MLALLKLYGGTACFDCCFLGSLGRHSGFLEFYFWFFRAAQRILEAVFCKLRAAQRVFGTFFFGSFGQFRAPQRVFEVLFWVL